MSAPKKLFLGLALSLVACGVTAAQTADKPLMAPKLTAFKVEKASGDSATPRCPDALLTPDIIRAMVEKEATDQGVDAKLAVAIARQESGFGQNNNSDLARGPMQLMPDTASRFGVQNICDPAENIRGGVSLLKLLLTRYNNNIMLVLAAYNAGEMRVTRARGIPSNHETVDYVARITNSYYGLDKTSAGAGKENASTVAAIGDSGADEADGQPMLQKGQKWIGGFVLNAGP